jgi:hypothetical protein
MLTITPLMLLQEIDVISEINCLKIQDLLLDVTIIGLFSVIYRAVIDLTEIEREVTHTIDQSLEDEGGVIKLLLTISGTIGTETISDLANYTSNPREKIEIIRKYVSLFDSLSENHFQSIQFTIITQGSRHNHNYNTGVQAQSQLKHRGPGTIIIITQGSRHKHN